MDFCCLNTHMVCSNKEAVGFLSKPFPAQRCRPFHIHRAQPRHATPYTLQHSSCVGLHTLVACCWLWLPSETRVVCSHWSHGGAHIYTAYVLRAKPYKAKTQQECLNKHSNQWKFGQKSCENGDRYSQKVCWHCCFTFLWPSFCMQNTSF